MKTLMRCLIVPAVAVLALAATSCDSRPSNQEIQQRTADATRDVKQGAKELAKDSKAAAASAVDGVNAVANGVKQGVDSTSADSGSLVDINSASTARIALLPGISATKAHDIVKGRPYPDAHSLVSRDLLTQAQYDRIAGKITAN